MRETCVIGGSRYFGRRLVELLRDGGDRVTVVNRGSVAPPPGVEQLIADRDDAAALDAALGGRDFDVVLDQVCYTPAQAAVARTVFAERTGRYVMTSTMEVYDPATSDAIAPARAGEPVVEERVDPTAWPVDAALWRDPERAARSLTPEAHYAEGKRQAEAVFSADPVFPYVSVRSAHVLGGGARDFTGRLAYYTERIADRRPVDVHRDPMPTSFVDCDEIADFLHWVAGADFVGPVNACAHGEFTVTDLCELVAARVGVDPVYRVVDDVRASPYSFDRYYAMDNGRAERLGFTFHDGTTRLRAAIAAAVARTGA
ncbi:reductase [Embleya sp. NBC_00896]|uniref:reductase n=1 Tax=Embleya sp. NBC_00896 TaxID=2975961 RepID=UPI002F9172B3|nr:reductase [Embleya sp. NBC_00896]